MMIRFEKIALVIARAVLIGGFALTSTARFVKSKRSMDKGEDEGRDRGQRTWSIYWQMITPMVARLVRDPFDREGWLFELKWDGFRAIAETDGQGAVKLYSRNQNDFKKRFPPIAQALAELGRPTILDGEIVALDEQGHPRFEWLVNRGPQRGTLVYYVFDLLSLDGKDLRQLPLEKRKARLAKLLKSHPRLSTLTT